VLDAARVSGMLDRWLRILAAVVAGAERPLAELLPADAAPRETGAPELAILSGEL
jgi:hypothetical protein